ncbi:MAG: hypothetical protein ACRBN8_30705 [Nannocystales bacterium]
MLLLSIAACGDDGGAPADETSAADGESSSSSGGETSGGDADNTTAPSATTSTSVDSSSSGDVESSSSTGEEPDELIVTLPGTMLFPEGIDADEGESLYVGGLTASTIFRIDPPYTDDDVSTFSDGELDRGVIGVFVDDEHGLLFACDSDPFDPVASSLVALDLSTGVRVAEHPLTPVAEGGPVFCNDGLIGEDGHAYISDSFGARVLRVRGDELEEDGTTPELFVEGPELGPDGEPPFGPNGITELDGELYLANFNRGTLLWLQRDGNGDGSGIVELALTTDAGEPTVLLGPDGIEATDAGTLLVVENGVFAPRGGNRVVEVELDGTSGVVREVAAGFDTPTTAVATEGRLWVVEGQFEHAFGLDKGRPDPFQIVGIPWE